MNKRFGMISVLFAGLLLAGAACSLSPAANKPTNSQPDSNENVVSNANVSVNVNDNSETTANRNSNTSDGVADWVPLFGEQTKSAHFVSSTPAHASVLAAAPSEVVLNFNFDLATNSTVSVTATDPRSAIASGIDVAAGDLIFDADDLTMRLPIDANTTAEKLYAVNYRACWPDKSCHDGRFDFAVDPN